MSVDLVVAQKREMILAIESELIAKGEGDGIVIGNSEAFPLTHSFSEGVYIREMFMGKDGIVIGKIHKNDHTWFLMKGELVVATDEKTSHHVAPCYVNAPAGAKRVITAIEDSVFVNVFPNPDNIRDIEKLEEILTCPTYENFETIKKLKINKI